MSQTLEEKRIEELTKRVEDFLCEGEEFLIRQQEDEIEVLPAAEINTVRKNHEDLYGFLLALQQQLLAAAAIPQWIVRFLVFFGILAVELEWLADLKLPIDISKLQNWWLYGLFILLGYAVNSFLREWRQSVVYAARRAEFLPTLQESGLTKYRLLTQIEGDEAVSLSSYWLKKDHTQEARY